MSIFHQHRHPTLKYYSDVIYQSSHELGSVWWEIRASPTRYKINMSSKPLSKIDKLIFTKI